MSDEEFTKEDWEKINKMAVEKAGSILESAEHPFFAKKNLFIAVITNLILFLIWLFLPHFFLWLFPNDRNVLYTDFFVLYVFLILGSFCCGFVIVYIANKLFHLYYSKNETTEINSGFMSGFSYVDNRNKNWKIWFLSAAGGVGNLLITVVLTNFLRQTVMEKILRYF